MLETLLESKSKGHRSAGGAFISVTAHTVLIAAALYATAQARVEPTKLPETIRPFYFPCPQSPVPTATPTTARQPRSENRRLIFIEPRLDLNLPPIQIGDFVSKPNDFGPTGIVATAPKAGGEIGANPDAPFRADQVERQVEVVPGSAPPQYPELLRNAGVEGQVTAVFVVDEGGRAEEGSVRFTRSDNRLFEDTVRAALRRMRFIPAEVAGAKVRQLVQMPFVFTLAR
jgi:protein TonB